MKQWTRNLLAIVSLLIVWELMFFMTKGLGIPSVTTTLINTVKIFPILMNHLWVSALRLAMGLSIALILGSFLGYLMAKHQQVDTLLSPVVYLITPLPKVAFLPIMMVIFGISENARIVVLVFVVVFQFVLGTKDALKAMPSAMIMTMDSLKLSKKSQLKDIIVPYCMPSLFTSFRQAFGMSLAVLFFLETFVNQKGIGYFIMNRWGMVNYPDMFSGIVVLSIFGYFVYRGLDWLENTLVKG